MSVFARCLHTIRSNYVFTFLFGMAGGAGFELFKIHFKFYGFDYYTSFTKLQVPKELSSFEEHLKSLDYILMEKYEPENLPEDYIKKKKILDFN